MKAKTTDSTNLLRDRCLSHFTTLRIPVQPAALDELLTRAEKENLSYLNFLDRLLGAEAGARRARAASAMRVSLRPRHSRGLTGTSTRERSAGRRSRSSPPATSSGGAPIW
jgi:hypothetical protein